MLGDQHDKGGNERRFWLHLLRSSCLFFHCPVPRRRTPKGQWVQSVSPHFPHHSPSATSTHGGSRGGVWGPRVSDACFQGAARCGMEAQGCSVMWTRTQGLRPRMTWRGRPRSLRVEAGTRAAWWLGMPEGGHAQGGTLGASPQLPPPPPKRTLRNSASTKQSHEQSQSRGAGRTSAAPGEHARVGGWGEVLASDCTPRRAPTSPQLGLASPPLLAPNLENKPRVSGRASAVWAGGFPGPGSRRPPPPQPAPPPSSFPGPRSRSPGPAARPRAGALRAEAARAAVRGRRRRAGRAGGAGAGGSARAGAGAALLRKQRERGSWAQAPPPHVPAAQGRVPPT